MMMKVRKSKYFTHIIIYAISVLFLGAVEFVKASFDLERVFSSVFVFNVVIPSVINFMILINTILMFHKMIRENHELVKKKKDEIQKNIDAVRPDFDIFWTERTLKKKKDKYLSNIRRKIQKLDDKATMEDLILWASGNEEAKQKNKYCIKKTQLLELCKDEYVDANIAYMHVEGFKPIQKSELFNDFKTNTDGEFDEEKEAFENENKRAIRELLPAYLQGLLFTAVFYSFLLEPGAFSWMTVASFSARLISALWNYVNGRNYTEDQGLKSILNNLDTRNEIFKEYFEWRIERKKQSEVKPLEANNIPREYENRLYDVS